MSQSLRERAAQLNVAPGVVTLFREFARADRKVASVALVLAIARGVLPPASALAVGALIARLPAAIREEDIAAILPAAAAIGGLLILGQALGALERPVVFLAGSRFTLHLRSITETAALSPVGISHMEDDEFADRLAQADALEYSNWAPAYVISGLLSTMSGWLAGFLQALILFSVAWWAPLLLIASFLPVRRWIKRDVEVFVQAADRSTGDLRRATYLRESATGSAAAKEVRIFGLADNLVGQFGRYSINAMSELWAARRGNRALVVHAAIAQAIGYGTVFWILVQQAIDGRLSLVATIVGAQAALGLMPLIYGGDGESAVRHGAPVIRRVVRLAEAGRPTHDAVAAPSPPGRGSISFEDVSFSYPGQSVAALSHVSFSLDAGDSLAVVGHNGAGKSTLVKLLLRLYEPTNGRITYGGVDIRDFAVSEWRERLGVVFQDFIHYALTLEENVTLGASDLPVDEAQAALTDAGGRDLVDDVGWDTVLSPAYPGGADLSGGQWQRVGVARALAVVRNGASVLVLDEPTAHLDARLEAHLFEDLLATQQTTTILLSHRFSSVRHAARIIVLENGEVVEVGSHAELLELGGTYASMFRTQARQVGVMGA